MNSHRRHLPAWCLLLGLCEFVRLYTHTGPHQDCKGPGRISWCGKAWALCSGLAASRSNDPHAQCLAIKPRDRHSPCTTSISLYQRWLAPGSWSVSSGRTYGNAATDEVTGTTSVPAATGTHAKSAAVIGGGPVGLSTAIMLARRGWPRVDVFDELPAPPPPSDPSWGVGERSYQIGLNGRGQRALSQIGCMERIDQYAVLVKGRLALKKDGTQVEKLLKPPGTPGATKRTYSRVLQRDRLQACLLEEIEEKYPSIHLNFSIQCEGINVSGERPLLQLRTNASTVEHGPVDLVVGADGVRSAVRDVLVNAPGSTTELVEFPDDNQRLYKTIPLHPDHVPGTRCDLNWATRNDRLKVALDALPTKEGQMIGVLLFRPGTPIFKRIESVKGPEDARQLFEDALPQVLPFLEEGELERFASRPIGQLPCFRLLEGDVHMELPGGAVVLLGDSIKTVKPYFGQGCNSGLQDVSVLDRCLEETEDSPREAALHFSERRGEDARALVRMSRSFDWPGTIGIVRFALPVLVDSLLHKLLPWVFSPPIFFGIADENNDYADLESRKRKERAWQFGILGGLVVMTSLVLRVMRRLHA